MPKFFITKTPKIIKYIIKLDKLLKKSWTNSSNNTINRTHFGIKYMSFRHQRILLKHPRRRCDEMHIKKCFHQKNKNKKKKKWRREDNVMSPSKYIRSSHLNLLRKIVFPKKQFKENLKPFENYSEQS